MSFQLPQGLRPAQPPSGSGGAGRGGGSPGGGGAGPSQPGGGGGDQAEAAERQRQNEEMKRGMIASMLTTDARERCRSVSLSHLGTRVILLMGSLMIELNFGSIENSIDTT